MMHEFRKEELAELREIADKAGMNGAILSSLLDAAESRLRMLEALSAERAEEIAFLLPLSMTEEEKDLRAYALAAQQKGAGE